MTNEEKKKIAEAARTVAKEAASGRRFDTGSPFCTSGGPKCAMGFVLALVGYRGKEGHTTFAIAPSGEEVDTYHVFHEAIGDPIQDNKALVARIWRSNDRLDGGALAEALNDFADEVERTLPYP